MAKDWDKSRPQGSPLTPTDRGWVARINGRPRWICGAKPHALALAIYHRKAAVLTAGRALMPLAPSNPTARPTLHWMLNKWLDQKLADAEAGELQHRTFGQYRRSCRAIDKIAGTQIVAEITPDWTQELYNRIRAVHSVDSAKRAISHLQTAVRHAEDMRWVSGVTLGNTLVKKLIGKGRPTMKFKLFTGPQIRQLLTASLRGIRSTDGRGRSSKLQLHAMILLALNGGYGATELSELTRSVIDLDNAKIDHARGKTGASHVVPLWPETVAALRRVMDLKLHDTLVFLTREENPWTRVLVKREGKKITPIGIDNVNERYQELCESIGLRIKGQGFYKLRHLHATTADAAGDSHATYTLMGHQLPGAKSHYVRVDYQRVIEVVNFIRQELILKRGSQFDRTRTNDTKA